MDIPVASAPPLMMPPPAMAPPHAGPAPTYTPPNPVYEGQLPQYGLSQYRAYGT